MAKRRLRDTWRDAVARRAAGDAPACLRDFDARVRAGAGEATAAYRTLEARGLLWPLPDGAAASPGAGSPEGGAGATIRPA